MQMRQKSLSDKCYHTERFWYCVISTLLPPSASGQIPLGILDFDTLSQPWSESDPGKSSFWETSLIAVIPVSEARAGLMGQKQSQAIAT